MGTPCIALCVFCGNTLNLLMQRPKSSFGANSQGLPPGMPHSKLVLDPAKALHSWQQPCQCHRQAGKWQASHKYGPSRGGCLHLPAHASRWQGGKEAKHSNSVLHDIIVGAIEEVAPEFGRDLIGLVTSREGVSELLVHDDVIDLVIPRGSNALVGPPQ